MATARRPQRAGRVAEHSRGTGVRESETVRVWLLGGFRVSVGSRIIEKDEWRLHKAASLAKLLALAPTHDLHREQITDRLWPDLDRKAAANNLRHTLHVARRVLESATVARYLVSQGERLAFCPGAQLWVDVEAFEDAGTMARRTREPAAYRAASNLYAGDLLPEDRYEDWLEGRREDLRQSFLSVLVGLARAHEERGEQEPAIEALLRATRYEPSHEEAQIGLIRLYALTGRRGEARGQYEQLKKTLDRRFATEPDAASRHLYEEILSGRFPQFGAPSEEVPDSGKHNLPASRTSLIGRKCELIETKRLLAMTRLLTLTGAGGSGKTRLAVEMARDLVGAYPDGVWLVALAPLSDPELVPQAAATALGVREISAHSVTEALLDHLRSKNLLLVLDNCEHLIDAVALLAELLLDASPNLRILATSREALGITGELNWPVPTLALPDAAHGPFSVDEIEGYESIRLFVERASCRTSTFSLKAENAQAVVEICQRLDGMPLAIELAAARVDALTVEQISGRLSESLKLLTVGARTATPRQQTLKGALDWSYDLLLETEKKLFGRLSTFVGGWTLEAAEAVGAGDGIEEKEVLDLISRLVDKSLVIAEAREDGTLRYKMLELVSQYGQSRLAESNEFETVRHLHAVWFLRLAEKAERKLRGRTQAACLKQLEREHDNLRAALSWALEWREAELGLRLGGALGEFWHMHGHLSEGRRWLEAVLAIREGLSASARAKALARVGYIAWEQGDYERSLAFSEESLALARELGDMEVVAAALSSLGWAALFQNDLQQASALTEEAISLQRASGDAVGVVRSLLILVFVANTQRDYERAMTLHEESLDLARKEEDGFALVLSLLSGAFAHLGRSNYQGTRSLCREGIELSRRFGMPHLTAAHLHILSCLAASQDQPIRSARLWGAAETLREAIGTILSPVEQYIYGPYIEAARTQLDEAEWDVAIEEGRKMSLEAAMEYALSEERSHTETQARGQPPSGRREAKLTHRQREIAVLVSQGLTNRRIATELGISEHTVATHVAKTLKKLGLCSRVQIAAWMTAEQMSTRVGEDPAGGSSR